MEAQVQSDSMQKGWERRASRTFCFRGTRLHLGGSSGI